MNAALDIPRKDGRAPITVLHVDDDQSQVDLTAEFLQRHHEGLTVRTATSPRKALEAGLEDIDCVVSDYEMPRMDGLEFLEQVRAEYPSLPFILFTGKGSEAVASEAISADVTDYLQKDTGTEQYELLCQKIENAVARRRARTNYRELFEKTPVGLTIHDPETGVITDTNRAFADFLGYEPGELVGTHPGELSPDGSAFTRENATQLIREAVSNGTQSFEWQDQTKDGDIVWVEVTLRPTAIDGRQRVLAVVQDITDRKERERTLEREKRRFEAIFEHSNDAIFVLDPPNDEIVDVNSRAEELLGYSIEELRNSVNISDIHPDHIGEFRSFLARVRQEGAGWTDEFCCLTKSGTEREVEISAAAIEHDDTRYLVANVRDVSERVERTRELEQVRDRMEFVLRATDAVIWERDPETGAVTTHPEPCPVLDGPIETAAEFRERVHPDDIPVVRETMEAATETGEAHRVEFRTAPEVTADWIETRIEPITDEDGSVELLTGLARDVTDHKQREQDLQRQNERLDEFVSVVSHDLRNPLRVAEGRLDLVREECDSEHLDDVARALDRMSTLVEDLLTLAHEGDRALDIQPIDLAEIGNVCWQTVETGDATLHTETDRTIRADRNQLRQLLENLVQNAIEHSDETVTVTIGDLNDRSGFYVADDGPGIPDDECDQIFDAGYTTSEDGTGFGLRIVRQIAESHEWDVSVTDSDTGGARFEITGVDVNSR